MEEKNKTITIDRDEYRILLEYKGRYEELKQCCKCCK